MLMNLKLLLQKLTVFSYKTSFFEYIYIYIYIHIYIRNPKLKYLTL